MTNLTPDNFIEFLPQWIWFQMSIMPQVKAACPNIPKAVKVHFSNGVMVDLSSFDRDYLNKYFNEQAFAKNSGRLATEFAKSARDCAAQHGISRLAIKITVVCDDRKDQYQFRFNSCYNNSEIPQIA